VAYHNPVTLTKTEVTFPSGVTITAGDDNRCMECRQGRESKVSVDKIIADYNAVDAPNAVPPLCARLRGLAARAEADCPRKK
jgi:hypothetical protein